MAWSKEDGLRDLAQSAKTLLSEYQTVRNSGNAGKKAVDDATAQAKTLMDMSSRADREAGEYAKQLQAQMNDLYDRLTGGFEDVSGYVTGNYYDTDEAKSILAQYRSLGQSAAANAAASAAAENGGNPDSYAAAQARRQLLGYTDAAADALRAQKESNVSSLLENLKQLSSGTGELQKRELSLLQGTRDYAAAQGENAVQAQTTAADTAAALEKNLGDVYTELLASAAKQYQTDADRESAERISAAEQATKREIAEKQAEEDRYEADLAAASRRESEQLAYLKEANTGKANESNPSYNALYSLITSVMNGKSQLTDGKKVSANVAAELLLRDKRYEGMRQLIQAIVRDLEP